MATKKTDTAVMSPEQHAEAVRQMMERLRQPTDSRTLLERITAVGERVVDAAVDYAADSGDTLSRFGAAAHSAAKNAAIGYELEMERQLKRRAEKLIAHQQKMLR